MDFWQDAPADISEFYQSDKFKVWVILPKITGAVSIIGSALIIRDVFPKENRRKKLKATTNRIVFLMSICDVIFSLVGPFLGTWLVPKDVGVWSAAGSQATCTFQGFVASSFTKAGTGLNAALAMTYVLVVRFGWKDEKLQTHFMSSVLLGVPVLASLGYSCWPLINQAYNWPGAWGCGIAPDPFYCAFSEVPCVRGTHAPRMMLGSVIWIQVCFAVIFVSTVTMYRTVLGRERATDRYVVGERQSNRKQSKRVAMQGIWYAGSFFFTWIFWWIAVIVEYGRNKRPPYSLLIMLDIFLPLHGFFNAIVYFRPRRNKVSCLHQSSFGLFSSCKRSGDVPSSNGATAGMGAEQFKKEEEEKWEEEAPVASNKEP